MHRTAFDLFKLVLFLLYDSELLVECIDPTRVMTGVPCSRLGWNFRTEVRSDSCDFAEEIDEDISYDILAAVGID